MIHGSKTFITNGVNSDYIVAASKTDSDVNAKGLIMIFIERDLLRVNATKRDKLGWKASDTGEITFDNVRVPATNLLGEENKDFYYIVEHFVSERLSMAAASTASATLALETTIKYLNEREAFGQTIGKFQILRHRVAQMAAEIELNRQSSVRNSSPSKPYGFVIGVTADEEVVHNLQDTTGATHGITSAIEHQGALWMGSNLNEVVVKYKINQNSK